MDSQPMEDKNMTSEFPRAYQAYLDAVEPSHVGTVRPVMQESVAEREYGVLVRFLGPEVHAMVSEAVPFGVVREEHRE